MVAWSPWLPDALVLLAILVSFMKNPRTGIWLIALQGVLLALFPLGHGFTGDGLLAAGSILLLKGVLVPSVVFRAAREAGALDATEPPSFWSYGAVFLVIFLVERLSPALDAGLGGGAAHLLGAAFSIFLLGLSALGTRRLLPNQILGLVLAENGLDVAAIALTGGLPLALDLALILDLLLAVFVLGWLTVQIRHQMGHVDVDQLNRLRG